MKILIYSDLHLEFGNPIKSPLNCDADLMILAGDIITFNQRGFEALSEFLKGWEKPVLFVAGNHEYYNNTTIEESYEKAWKYLTGLVSGGFHWLTDAPIEIDDVKFFGGTMWTDFNKRNPLDMIRALQVMNDYQMIKELDPQKTVDLHEQYKKYLIRWLEEEQGKKRVVISHHAPCFNPKSNFKNSKLQAAYNSLDMIEIIEKYQPELWIYGHTHEPDDQMIGKTRIVSNPFGYYQLQECKKFNSELIIEI